MHITGITIKLFFSPFIFFILMTSNKKASRCFPIVSFPTAWNSKYDESKAFFISIWFENLLVEPWFLSSTRGVFSVFILCVLCRKTRVWWTMRSVFYVFTRNQTRERIEWMPLLWKWLSACDNQRQFNNRKKGLIACK